MERHYTNSTEPDVLPHFTRCTGPCQQGRVACPCPTSCQIEAELDENTFRLLGKAFLAVVLALAVIAIGVALT